MARLGHVAALTVALCGCPSPRFIAIVEGEPDAATDATGGDALDTAPADVDGVDAPDGSTDASGDCSIEPSWLDQVQVIRAPVEAEPGGWFSRDLLLHEGELFVGSPSESAVYRYTLGDDRRWTQVQRLAGPGDLSGWGIALSAHDDLLAVGSLDERGGVSVFERRDDGTWVPAWDVDAPADADSLFGRQVALGPDQMLVNDSRLTWGLRTEGERMEIISSIAPLGGIATTGPTAIIGDTQDIDFEFRTVGGFAEYDLRVRPFYSLTDTQFVDDIPVVTVPLGGTATATDAWLAISSCGARHVAVFERNGRAWEQRSLVGVHTVNADAGCDMDIDPTGWIVDGGPGALGLTTQRSGSFGLYQRTDAGWGTARIIQPPMPSDNGMFGSDVSIEYPWVAVGSLGSVDGSGDTRGMVTMYRFSAACPDGAHGVDCTFRCDDGVRNGGERDVDDGGPCVCAGPG